MCPFVFSTQRGTPPEEGIDKSNNQPHLIVLEDPDTDLPTQIFVAVEQMLVQQCRSLRMGIFVMLADHYIFNMEYHSKVKEVFLFLQEFVMQHEVMTGHKRSPTYSNIAAAVQAYTYKT